MNETIRAVADFFACCSAFFMVIFAAKLLIKSKEYRVSELGKENARLEELITSREANIAALEEEINELQAQLDEYRAFGIMHPTEGDNG